MTMHRDSINLYGNRYIFQLNDYANQLKEKLTLLQEFKTILRETFGITMYTI